MMEKENLIEIANTVMPFGKYQGRVLIDLPEEYLLWFARKGGIPQRQIGDADGNDAGD
ncbi:DNA polymerase III subunit epsilon [Serratia odorifera]|uniref:DNA polymerase III subunit epsilon n=1 Tax=Serratia odorifera TaxID=618 RepID=A0A3S4ECW2_SEROD|nr:DNA polymerase III subunit epsilon [Serratia odorifera]